MAASTNSLDSFRIAPRKKLALKLSGFSLIASLNEILASLNFFCLINIELRCKCASKNSAFNLSDSLTYFHSWTKMT